MTILGYQFFNNYLDKLNEYLELVPSILDDNLTDEQVIEVKELEKYLTINFDRFNEKMTQLGVDDFPHDTAPLLGKTTWKDGWNRSIYYLSSEAYEQLLLNRDRFTSILKNRLWLLIDPEYFLKTLIKFILKMPYRTISAMGFDPEKFIETFWGKLIALGFFIVFLLFLGFSGDQLVEIIKYILN